jgi:dTMP kinase
LGLRKLLLEGHSSLIQDRAELLLYAADRAQHVEEFLKPQLALGTIILCDRYTDSTIAYQGYGRGLSLHLIQQLNQIATGGLESDLTLWLDIDAETGLKRARQRGTADRIEQADLAFHRRVQQGFTQLAASNPQRIVRIDASKSEQEVHLAIQEIFCQRFSEWFQKLIPPC